MAQQLDPEKYRQLGSAEISLTIRAPEQSQLDPEKYRQLGETPVDEPIAEPELGITPQTSDPSIWNRIWETPEFVKPFYQKLRKGSETGVGEAIRAGNPFSNLLMSKTGIDMM